MHEDTVSFVLHDSETWSLTLRKEHFMGVWEKGAEEGGSSNTGENFVMRRFVIYTSQQKKIRMIKPRRMRRSGHVARMGHEKCLQNFGQEI